MILSEAGTAGGIIGGGSVIVVDVVAVLNVDVTVVVGVGVVVVTREFAVVWVCRVFVIVGP